MSLLMVGQYVPTSGLTSVVEQLMSRLSRSFRVSLIGLNYRGPRLEAGARIYPDVLSGREIASCANADLEAVLAAEDPDVIFLFADVSEQAFRLRQMRSARPRGAIVAYTAVDGELVDGELLLRLNEADLCVFFSEFGLRQARKHGVEAPLAVIPHGVDSSQFYPIAGSVDGQFEGEGRAAVRRAMFGERQNLADAFIVLNANRPWLRKRIDLTMQGFALFAKDKPADVKLFLHHARTDERERARILRMANRLGIAERLLVNPIVEGRSEVSAADLNRLYNACDVGVNTAMGEGWGLVSFEHAATGAPQIVPRHSACADIWDGAAEFLEPIDDDVFLFAPHCRLKTVSPEEMAAKLETFYRHPAYRRTMAHAAYARATQPQYQWAAIADQWTALFHSLCSRPS